MGEAVVVPELVSSPGRRWKGGVRKGADDIAEIPAIRRFAKVGGSAKKARRGCIPTVRKWGVRYRG